MPDLAPVGFPIAEIDADGTCIVGKADGTGGVVDEPHGEGATALRGARPGRVSHARRRGRHLRGRGARRRPDRVAVGGVRGHPRPDTLKVIAFFAGGWLGEGEISYAGPNAEARARLAADVVRAARGRRVSTLRFDLIGVAERLRRRRGRLLGRHAAGGRARRPAARRGRRIRSHQGGGAAARGHGALHLRPGRRRGRADRDHPRLESASCLVPREPVPPTFTWRSDGMSDFWFRCTASPTAAPATRATAPTSA